MKAREYIESIAEKSSIPIVGIGFNRNDGEIINSKSHLDDQKRFMRIDYAAGATSSQKATLQAEIESLTEEKLLDPDWVGFRQDIFQTTAFGKVTAVHAGYTSSLITMMFTSPERTTEIRDLWNILLATLAQSAGPLLSTEVEEVANILVARNMPYQLNSNGYML